MTVILVDPRRPSLVPVEAIELLTGEVQYTEEMPVAVPWSLPAARSAHTGEDAPVLLSSDADHPSVTARLAAGERLIAAPGHQPGERLVDAVAMMDKLRTAGPWESEQTHDSLRRFLLEETYELFDAVHSGDADALRDELGDVLLQVLFHARIAEDAPHIRSPSTTSPTRCCESWATGLRESCRRVGFTRRTARPMGGAQSAGETPHFGDGRRAHRAAGFGVGAQGGSACDAGRVPDRSDSGRGHLDHGDI